MERRVSPLSTKAHRLSLLSCVKVWCAANRAPSADPLTSTEDEHQQHVHKHQNRDHSKHRASLDIQGHGAALQADAEMRSQVSGRIQLSTASRHVASKPRRNPPLQWGEKWERKMPLRLLTTRDVIHKGTGRDASFLTIIIVISLHRDFSPLVNTCRCFASSP